MILRVPTCALRRGVTVIEVLFATGIAIFGLVGIASLISVAGRQATDANNSSEGQAVAQVALNDFVTRGFNSPSRWLWYNDQLPVSNRFVNFASHPTFGMSHTWPRGTTVPGARTAFRHAICFDPMFFADPTTAIQISDGSLPHNNPPFFRPDQPFRPGLFPYFQDNFDPVTGGTATPPYNFARLLRVSLSDVTGGVISAKTIDHILQTGDDLAVYIPDEGEAVDDIGNAIETQRVFNFLPNGSYGQSLSKGEYSWFATLSPREFGVGEIATSRAEDFYTLSVVICKRRDRAFVPDLDALTQSERLFSIEWPVSPFLGGSGGRVTLHGSVAFDDTLRVGDWLMLSRHQTVSGVVGTVCRWFRIIALDAEPVVDLANGKWSRTVALDGPDWAFAEVSPGTGIADTQATHVSGVVAVLERVIPLE